MTNFEFFFHGFKCVELQDEYDWLIGFYGISTVVGYLMPDPVYTDEYIEEYEE